MLVPAFQLHLTDQITKDKATVARYDGKHPCLTCATTGAKVFVHSPHTTGTDEQSLFYLNINREITALSSGRLSPRMGRDVLLVGTPTNLQAYDVEENKDLFFKDVSDGVASLVVGTLGGLRTPVAIAGGNCSVQGFDAEGEEAYWTVAGDVVTAVALADINGDGANELIVGGKDFDIRIFQNEDCIAEITEAEVVTGLVGVTGSRFGYSLGNGTVGVYDRRSRAWRVKSKHKPHSITSFDMDGDGVPELISGWSNGKVEIRNQSNGQVVLRDTMNTSVSAVLHADYRNDGTDCLMVCSQDGEVKGYMPFDQDQGRRAVSDVSSAREALADLSQNKNELRAELERLADRNRQASTMSSSSSSLGGSQASLIPQGTDVTCLVKPSASNSSVDLVVATNNISVIRGVLVFGEQMFDGESLYVCSKKATNSVTIPVRPRKDVIVEIMLKVFVSSSATSPVFKVFELETRLSKYCMFDYLDSATAPRPESYVQLSINERMQRMGIWLEERFSVKASNVNESSELDVSFTHLRTQLPLRITITPSPDTPLKICIRSDSMDLAAELVQDLASYLNLQDLESAAEFPAEMDAFMGVLQQVEDYNATRLLLTAEVAESSNLVKALVIRAEDARIQGNIQQMKKCYRQLYDVNRELMNEHEKRATNYSQLLEGLKEVNQVIQTASRLRVGPAAKRVVAACRQAIKTQNNKTLLKILKSGHAS